MAGPPSAGRAAVAVACAAALVAALPPEALAQGCAMCRRNLEEGGAGGLVQGIRWSNALLVATPAALVAGFALLLRRAARARAAATVAGGATDGAGEDPKGVVAATGLEPVT